MASRELPLGSFQTLSVSWNTADIIAVQIDASNRALIYRVSIAWGACSFAMIGEANRLAGQPM